MLALHTAICAGSGKPVIRLHRRDHAQPAETRDIGRVDRFDVLDPMSATTSRQGVCLGSVFESVERHPNRAIANCVDHHLPTATVEFRHQSIECFSREARLTAGVCAIAIRLEHRRRVRFDDAVRHQLDRAGLENRVVSVLLTEGVERVELLRRKLWLSRECGVDPQIKRSSLAQLVVDLELLSGSARRSARSSRRGDGPRAIAARTAATFSSRVGFGMSGDTMLIAASFSTPVGSPVRAIFHDDAVGGIL